MAQITEVSTTESSITVRVSGLASTAKYCEFYIDDDLDKYYTLSGTSQKHTYTGLRSGRTYTCSAIVYDANWKALTFKNNSIDITTGISARSCVSLRKCNTTQTDHPG